MKVDDYTNLFKILVLFYIGLRSIFEELNPWFILLFFLSSIIINISALFLDKRKKCFLLFLNALVSFIFYKYIPLSILFYTLNVIEIAIYMNIHITIMIGFVLIPIISFNSFDFILEYLIFSSICYIFLFICDKYKKVKENLDYNIRYQGKEIYKLNKKLEKEEQYRKQSLYTFKLEERNKLSQRVHDKVGHTIAGTLMQLEATKIVLDKDTEKGKLMIDNSINVLRGGMEDIRKILKEIHPSDEQLGLNKVKLILEEKTNNVPFNYSIIYHGDLEKISKEQWFIIIESVTETSTNSLKYSNGNKYAVNLEVLNKIIKIEMKDNGLGCKNIIKSIGLSSIEQRVLEIGGKFIIDGNDGFTVILLLPIKE